MKIYRIYKLSDPNTLQIKYIGCTTATLKARLSQHIYDAKTRKSVKAEWIRLLISQNLKPVIELLEEGNELNWQLIEQKYIAETFLTLTNHTKGGDGLILNRSTDSITKSSNAKFKKIVQLNFNGELIKVWSSVMDAANHFNVVISGISNVLNGRSKSSCGFFWMFEEEYLLKGAIIKARKNRINLKTI